MPNRPQIRQLIEQAENRDRTSAPLAFDGTRFLISRATPDGTEGYYFRRVNGSNDELLVAAPRDADGRPMDLRLHGLAADGSVLAYGARRTGSEQYEIAFLDTTTKRPLTDRLPTAIYSPMFMLSDRSGAFYIRRAPAGHRLVFHRFGDDPSADREVFGAGFDGSWILQVQYSADGRFIAAFANRGAGRGARTDVYLLDRTTDTAFRRLFTDAADATFRGAFGGRTLYLLTTWNAPNGRVISLDASRSDRPWQELVPESPRVLLQNMQLAGGVLLLQSSADVKPQLQIIDVTTKQSRAVKLPTLGTIGVTAYGWEHPNVFLAFASLTRSAGYLYDVRNDRRISESTTSGGDLQDDDIEAKQTWYTSKDGTRVPMFVFHRKGIARDGNRPTLLSGYGGYGAISLPFGSTEGAVWVRSGGVYAFANIRGGGELGESWHQDGILEKKQNSFDDFLAAADWLVKENYTRPERLAIIGQSNGGMLVSVAAVQRPDLFRAVVSRAAHLDMIRYHRFLAAAPWVTEFGSPDVKEEFAYLYRYSPYQNVKDGERYPAMMFVTGDADTRVAPLHSRKMTARMQAATRSGHPVLLRYDMLAGHGGAMGTDRITQLTDELVFLFFQLGVALADSGVSRR